MTPIVAGMTAALVTLHWLAIAWLWSWLRDIRRTLAETRRTVRQHQGSIVQLTATLANLAPVDRQAPMATHMPPDEFADLFPATRTPPHDPTAPVPRSAVAAGMTTPQPGTSSPGTLRAGNLRGRPPSIITDLPTVVEPGVLDVLRNTNRPLTRNAIAEQLGWTTWQVTNECRVLMLDRQITMVLHHDQEPAWTLTPDTRRCEQCGHPVTNHTNNRCPETNP